MSPKMRNNLHAGSIEQLSSEAYAAIIATALRRELGGTHRAVKTVRRWTGAGERTVTNWLAAEHGPSGPHLAMLSNHSDAVLEAFLIMSGRERVVIDFEVSRFKRVLLDTVERLEETIE